MKTYFQTETWVYLRSNIYATQCCWW